MLPPPAPSKPRRTAGFTLVEIMFVVSIMVLLFAVGAAGAKKSWQSQELRASAIHLTHDLSLACLTAQKLNQPVEVRFYQYMADVIASPDPHYHAYQLLTYDSTLGKLMPLYELQTFEGTTLMSPNARFTSIMHPPQSYNAATDPNLIIGNYQYISIEFRPNGTTNLAQDAPPWTITLIPALAADNSGTLPKEYQVIRIHPDSGTVQLY